MKRYRVLNVVVGGLALLATEAGRQFYCPYVCSYDIQDYRVADTLAKTVATVAATFITILAFTGKNTSWDYRFISMLAAGLSGYELLQGPMGGAIDRNDIVAAAVAGFFCLGLCWLLHRHLFTLRGLG